MLDKYSSLGEALTDNKPNGLAVVAALIEQNGVSYTSNAIVPYNRLLHACLLHARLLHGCDVTHISSIGRFATSISLREHANERYVDPDSMFRNELVLKTF